jgi:MFS transporter, OPA family, sugar phosphate sensor protein UhpC
MGGWSSPMFKRAFAALREAKNAPRIEDRERVETLYRLRRFQVLVASMIGYGLFYFCRNDLSNALPLLQKDLHFKDEEVGRIGFYFYLSYGACKFLTGLVADRANPRTLMVLGLLLSACVNIAFGLSSSLGVLAALWTLNGLFQSAGAPASAKVIAVWFSAGERGTKTSIWNISHQGGGGLVLLFAGFCAQHLGWRGAMIVPALVALGGALAVMPFLHDHPGSHGLPPVEEWKEEAAAESDDRSFLALFLTKILFNPRVWVIALASMCTYYVRYGALLWTPKYLQEVRGMSPMSAGASTSLLELIGIPGALLCGWLSDRAGARRAPVVCASLLFLAASVYGLLRVPPGHPWLDLLLLAAIGFFTYGPQMLLAGVAPIDMSEKRVAAAAVGFTGLVSYAGASASSYVTGALLEKSRNWQPAFDSWALAALCGAVLCLPLWYASPVKKAREAKA